MFCGLADRLVASADLPDLIDALSALSPDAGDEGVRDAIARLAQEPGPPPLAAHRETVDRCFSFDMVDEILSALDADGSAFAADARMTLLEKAPSSLVLTLCLLRVGRAAPNLEACLEREFQASLALLEEGIRAAVIDKDKAPRWNPATLAEVDPGRIARWLEPRAAPVFS